MLDNYRVGEQGLNIQNQKIFHLQAKANENFRGKYVTLSTKQYFKESSYRLHKFQKNK